MNIRLQPPYYYCLHKATFWLLGFLVVSGFAFPRLLSAQQSPRPTIQYILPDVCAPNMSAYIEIIAAPSDTTSFGRDGLYANNPGDAVRVELERPGDSTKVIIGPVVVSWNGRLISTQVFVLPTVKPDNSYWDNLASEFRIPIRVVVGGRADSTSLSDTLYLVKPFASAGDFTRRVDNDQNNLIIGEILENGTTPKSVRSRRGALIVGNVALEGRGIGNATRRYSVSTLDCDPVAEGNQGFLPFVMLSTGKIDGGGAILSANANGRHGGPGGGGGGGQVCDASMLSAVGIPQGGDGFTGGASGGNNGRGAIIASASGWSSGGTGSGRTINPPIIRDPRTFRTVGGGSLNGVFGATSQTQFSDDPQSTGGGTGHPFGVSGRAWDGNANDQEPAQTAGGGIGRREGAAGDGGGYGTTGFSAVTNGFGGGQRHGNEFVVPLAGGSGGASGNPFGPTACGGAGGGGGGAIRIAAIQVENLTLEARGAAGIEGSGGFLTVGRANGGSGSGGHISVQSRTDAERIRINVMGGAQESPYFGAGRVRYDTPNRIGSDRVNNLESSITPLEKREKDTIYASYTGITLVPETQVVSPYTQPTQVKGFGGASGGIHFYHRTLRGRWEKSADTTLLSGGSNTHNSEINFPLQFTPIIAQPSVDQDSLVFVTVIQRSFGQTPTTFETIPEWIMSQTGTHILRVMPLPLIETSPATTSTLIFPQVERCGLETRFTDTSVTIHNSRGGLLRIDSIRVLSSHFRVETGGGATSVRQGDSLVVRLRFTATSALSADSLFARTTLQIFHNDTIRDIGAGSRPNPMNIALHAPVKTIQFIIKPLGISAVNGDARIDFGSVAVGGSRDTVINIPNTSGDAVHFSVSAQKLLSSTPFRFPEGSFITNSLQLRIRFQPDVAGTATTQTVIVQVRGEGRCSTDTISFRFALSGVGTRPQLDTVNTSKTLNFGAIAPVCYPDFARASAAFKIASGGNDILTAQIRMANAASPFVPSRSMLSLNPNSEDSIRVQFTAPATTQASTIYRDTLILITNDPRPEAKERRIPIAITVQSNFASISLAPPDILFGSVRFFNAVTRSVRITNSGNSPVTVNIGSLSTPYRIVRPTQSSLQLAPGGVDSIVVEIVATDAQRPDVLVRDVVRLSYTNVTAPCSLKPDTVALLATPTGPIAMQSRIWLDTLRDVNMLRDTNVRLFGQVITMAIPRMDTLRAAFKIRRGMFYPRAEAITSPFGMVRLDSNRADSLDRFVVITIPNVRLTTSTTLIATIGGTPIVTDTMRSAWEWVPSQTRWSRRDSVYDVLSYGNGLMVTNVVLQQIGNALVPRLANNAVRRATSIVSIYPMPAREELSIAAQMPEEGVHSVQIVNMLGARLLAQDWKPETQNNMPNAVPSVLTLRLASIPSGVYGVIVITPSGKRVSAMITIEK